MHNPGSALEVVTKGYGPEVGDRERLGLAKPKSREENMATQQQTYLEY